MSCKNYEEMISASLDGELTSSETDQLNSHLRSCQQCQAVLDSMKKIKELFKIQPEMVISEEFDQKFFARLTDLRIETQKKVKSRSWWTQEFVVPAPLAYAVIIIMLFLIGFAFFIKKPVDISPSKQYYAEKYVAESSQKIRKIKITKDDIILIHGQNHF